MIYNQGGGDGFSRKVEISSVITLTSRHNRPENLISWFTCTRAICNCNSIDCIRDKYRKTAPKIAYKCALKKKRKDYSLHNYASQDVLLDELNYYAIGAFSI